ncbi:Uncharacterised protein [uncultured Collinsella sp.]|nr:Uncharacterised protein [uncultured Collinsella sp.]
MIVTTLAGQSLTLENEPFNNTGSEGRLYNIKGKPDYVAKIFRTAELARKREQKALRPARIARRRSAAARWRTRCARRWACRLCRVRSAKGTGRSGLPRRCGELRTRVVVGRAAAGLAAGAARAAARAARTEARQVARAVRAARAAAARAARAVASQRAGLRPAPGLLGTRMRLRSLRAI